MKSVLIPVDFSEISFTAARYTAGLVSQLHSHTIILYHSFAEVRQDTGFVNTDEQEKEACMERLEFMKKRLQALVPTDVEIKLLCDNRAVRKGILQILKSHTVSFIVMGVSGLNHLNRDDKAVGKHTREILSIKEIPLLAVPRFVKFHPVKKIVFSTDLKYVEVNFPIVDLRKMIEQLGASLQVVYVDVPTQKLGIEEQENAIEIVKANLEGVDYSFEIIEAEEDVSRGLLDFAQQQHSDLIILASKDYTFFNRLFHNSVSRQVLKSAQVPVFIARS